MFPPSIGILIENPSFVSNYTAFENLKTLASIRKRIDDNRIRETLTEIGLDPDDKRTFHKFSLGMKQRLGIAAAIMENPDIIILDEPINALDDTGTEQIRDILIRHREELLPGGNSPGAAEYIQIYYNPFRPVFPQKPADFVQKEFAS